jgi:hypothetical protein
MFPFSLPGNSFLILALCAAVYLLSRFFLRRDEPVDDRRRQAIRLAGECKLSGLDFLAPLLEDFAVGDHSSLSHRLRTLSDDVRSESQRQALFDRLFQTQLAQRMQDPQSRQEIVAAMSRLDNSHAALLAELARHFEQGRAPAPTSEQQSV